MGRGDVLGSLAQSAGRWQRSAVFKRLNLFPWAMRVLAGRRLL
jgi:hypothetical protein